MKNNVETSNPATVEEISNETTVEKISNKAILDEDCTIFENISISEDNISQNDTENEIYNNSVDIPERTNVITRENILIIQTQTTVNFIKKTGKVRKTLYQIKTESQKNKEKINISKLSY